MNSQIDGIAIGSEGPILVHGYDPPAGGKWLDDVIPGKLGALDRHTGEQLWLGPCEVGYGRGFGAGIGKNGDALVLGPGLGAHRLCRMSIQDGELLDATEIAAFDDVCVGADVSVCVTAARVFAVDSEGMTEAWEYSREGERYHLVARSGDRAIVVFSLRETGRYGVLLLDAETGGFEGILLAPVQPIIHGISATGDTVLVLTRDLSGALPSESLGAFAIELAERAEAQEDGGSTDTLSLLATRLDGVPGASPLWFRILDTRPADDVPEVSVSADSGKLYLVRGAHLEALDALSGRLLGNWAVPGLDEQISWTVVAGAGLLAEETRLSLFELPA